MEMRSGEPDGSAKRSLLRVRGKLSERLKQIETGYLGKRQDETINRFRGLAERHDYETIIAEGEQHRDDPAVLLYVGMAHHFLGHFREAQSFYWESLYRRSNLEECSVLLVSLGSLLEDERRYEEAVNVWRIASLCDPANHMPYLNLMQYFCRMGAMERVCEEGLRLLSALAQIDSAPRREHIIEIVRSILMKKEQLEEFRRSADPDVRTCREKLFQATEK